MRTVHNKVFNKYGELLSEEIVEVPYPPLNRMQVIATLNAVLGLWTLQDAANVAGVSEEHLIAEAQAWAVAMEAAK